MNNVFAIEQAFRHYLDCYFTRRDLAATLGCFSPDASGVGTGRGEIAKDFAALKGFYLRELDEAPNTIAFVFREPPRIRAFAGQVGIVYAELDIETGVLQQTLIMRYLRLTIIFVKHGADWLIEHKHISFPTDVHGEDESFPIKELEAQNLVLERLVAQKTQELQQAVEEIGRVATTDKLTGLSNRLKIDDYLDLAMQQAEECGEPLSLILLDLDHFKRINDTLGHLFGDRVLRESSQLLCANIRATDLLGRWGGEEFLLISPGMALSAAVERAERMRLAVRSHVFAGLDHTQTASFGVACHRPGESREHLIARADMALYRAKQEGRDRVCVAEDSVISSMAAPIESDRN